MRLRLMGWILGLGLGGCATHAMTTLEGASTVGAPAPTGADASALATGDAGSDADPRGKGVTP